MMMSRRIWCFESQQEDDFDLLFSGPFARRLDYIDKGMIDDYWDDEEIDVEFKWLALLKLANHLVAIDPTAYLLTLSLW